MRVLGRLVVPDAALHLLGRQRPRHHCLSGTDASLRPRACRDSYPGGALAAVQSVYDNGGKDPAAVGGVLVWWQTVLGVVGGLMLLWAVVVVLLWRARLDQHRLSEALRLAPDLLRLLRRLAEDTTLPRGVRVRIGLLLAYLLNPIDLVPDFVPILGYADDAIVTVVALRFAIRRAGPDALTRHWPGSRHGLSAVHLLAGLSHEGTSSDPPGGTTSA